MPYLPDSIPRNQMFCVLGIESLFYAKMGIMYRPTALTFRPRADRIGRKKKYWTKGAGI